MVAAERISQCMDDRRTFVLHGKRIPSINSSTWKYLQALWQGTSLDLLRVVYKETQHQDSIEACGYRSPTWRIRLQQGNKLVLWESLSEEEKVTC